MRQGRDVDLNHLQLARELGLGELSAEAKAGVVNEDLDRDILVAEEIEDLLGRFASAEIGGEDVHFDVVFSLDLTGCCLERVTVAGDEDEIESFSGEDLRDLEPNAARAAGDETSFTRRAVPF